MTVALIDPASGEPLRPQADGSLAAAGARFEVVSGIPRICEASNYTDNFGLQWNKFAATQIDREDAGRRTSEERFFAETGWRPKELAGENILEVGSGAGRFSRVVLRRTRANLYSVDYSSSVEANWANNGDIARDRFHLVQASIYEMPFPDGSFDKVFCLGVLQHTPDFEASVKALVAKAKCGGEIVVDFYPIRGFWTKLHAKYLLRPITRRMSHDRLLKLIDANADWMIRLSHGLAKVRLGKLNRFLPLCDLGVSVPPGLPDATFREWVVLDTFDMYSPAYDQPQRVRDVARMFRSAGAEVKFAGFLDTGHSSAAVVRAVKK